MTKKEKIVSGLALAFLLVAVIALAVILLTREEKPSLKSKTFFGEYFNTVSTVYCYSDDSDRVFSENCLAVEGLLDEYHKLSDIYNEYEGINNLKTLNEAAGGEPIRIDSRLMDMLVYAKEIYTLTDGAVNVMLGAVLSLWHECREAADKNPAAAALPDPTALAEASRHCDINSLVLDRENMTAVITDPDASIDVGAIAKGYATERAAELLSSRGADGYALDIGSNMRTVGSHPTEGEWTVKIRNPKPTADSPYADEVKLTEGAVVTSGNYERYYTVAGKKYHHIINKDTLMPAEFFASVSVVHPDSGFADCMSTALFNMSYDDGIALIAKAEAAGYGKLRAIWISADGTVKKNY